MSSDIGFDRLAIKFKTQRLFYSKVNICFNIRKEIHLKLGANKNIIVGAEKTCHLSTL